jgi:hypothetical protein
MKRLMSLLTLLVALGMMAPGNAAQSKSESRTESRTYTGPSIMRWCFKESLGCAAFPTKKRDRYVSIQIDDASGRSVRAIVSQDELNPLWGSTDICGKTTQPVRIKGGLPVFVFLPSEAAVFYGTPCTASVAAAPTMGNIEATFSGATP